MSGSSGSPAGFGRRCVLVLIRKEWRQALRDTSALVPVVLFPLLFSIILPGAAVGLIAHSASSETRIHGLEPFLDLVASVSGDGMGPQQLLVTAVVTYVFAPLILIIPVIVATAGATAAFVGERERGTLEGLLYGPITVRELFLAKTLASVIPAVLLTWASFLGFSVVANAAAWPVMRGIVFPDVTWTLAVLVLVPLIAFLVISVIVGVSNRAKSVQSAQGIAVFFILPLVGMIVSQIAGALLFDWRVVALLGGVLAVLCVIAYLLVARAVEHDEIVLKI
ncbi:MAG: hypothetical protein DI576_07360 [Actinomyces sp.]|nr:MAG: hypothetical protein DI576_07360 [Actinomyces sp.]